MVDFLQGDSETRTSEQVCRILLVEKTDRWKGKRQPFDMLALTNKAYLKEKAAGADADGLFEIWLPEPNHR